MNMGKIWQIHCSSNTACTNELEKQTNKKTQTTSNSHMPTYIKICFLGQTEKDLNKFS